jgi:hypothetical protein
MVGMRTSGAQQCYVVERGDTMVSLSLPLPYAHQHPRGARSASACTRDMQCVEVACTPAEVLAEDILCMPPSTCIHLDADGVRADALRAPSAASGEYSATTGYTANSM